MTIWKDLFPTASSTGPKGAPETAAAPSMVRVEPAFWAMAVTVVALVAFGTLTEWLVLSAVKLGERRPHTAV
jgi:hypothetical protein